MRKYLLPFLVCTTALLTGPVSAAETLLCRGSVTQGFTVWGDLGWELSGQFELGGVRPGLSHARFALSASQVNDFCDLVVEVRSDDAGCPSEEVLATSGVLSVSGLPTWPQVELATATLGVELQPGVPYHLVWRTVNGTLCLVDGSSANACATSHACREVGAGWELLASEDAYHGLRIVELAD